MAKQGLYYDEPIIFEKSIPGRKAYSLPQNDCPAQDLSSLAPYRRKEAAGLPEISELEVVRHFTRISTKNFSVDAGFYPLGSCTMKYNPRLNEAVAKLDGFNGIHPYQPISTMQGSLELMFELAKDLAEITGMDEVTLQPAAGAHGELCGIKLIQAFHEKNGDTKRKKVIIPDSGHGTNPATAAVAGFEVYQIKSTPEGFVDLEELKNACDDTVAAIMLTNPNTLGMFEKDIVEIAKMVHDVGGLLYYDGANTNAIMGYVRPGDMGFDVVHLNLHKTFATPHGGGGPGAGPVGVKAFLKPFLPKPLICYNEKTASYYLEYDCPDSLGRMKTFCGNFAVLVRAYAYIRALGGKGLKNASELAVLNANYMKSCISEFLNAPQAGTCMHEFIVNPANLKDQGVHTSDIAKRIIDFGYHPPTIYFPLIVEEAMMFEPTETESKETMDDFIRVLAAIVDECRTNPEIVKTAPHNAPIDRIDDVKACRELNIRWEKTE
ncbi:MAG: aminomethyl-transferring glycine dehydrogenase subunit GcvPB [Clostridia bacterium]